MYYHLVTLGCQMNKSDSERVRTVLEEIGYAWTEDEDRADILGVLACSVRQKSIDKVYSRISSWNKKKSGRNLITFVSGCMLPADKLRFLKLFDLVFTMEELPDLHDMIRQYGIVTPLVHKSTAPRPTIIPENRNTVISGEDSSQPIDLGLFRPGAKVDAGDIAPVPPIPIRKFWRVQPTYQSEFEAFVPIQNGCDKFCTFCAVPYTRGREVSRPSSEILEEVRQLVSRAYKSITLLGQNVNSYGRDKKGDEISFAELLRRIGRIGNESDHKFWVYFTSPHPRDMTDEVIEVISRYPCLAKQVHLPLQSGDDKVLIKMNRSHNLEKYSHIINTIRRLIPQATIFTDIIVGFTGEDDAQFENSRKAMAEFQFNMAYIAIYSPRPGATSSRWDDDIPLEVKKNRLHKLTEELKIHSSAYNSGMIDRIVPVLVTGHDRKKGYLSGHTEGRIIIRFPSEDANLIGSFVSVQVGSSSDFSVEGTMVHSAEPEMSRK